MKHPLVSIILVNWNGKQYLSKCLRSLMAVTYQPFEIIIVDNASTDGSVTWIKKNYKQVRVVQNRENMGFAQGNNAGLPFAHGRYILLLNTDTTVDPSFLEPLIRTIEQDDAIGVVGPKIMLATDQTRIDSVGSFFLPNGLLYHYGREKNEKLPQYNIPMDVYSAKGACMLIRREIIDRVGLFDPDFFSYFEETDFCMRVWLAGYRVRYEPSSRVIHTGGAASSMQPQPSVIFHASKNVLCAYGKNLSLQYGIIAIAQMMLLYLAWWSIQIITGKFTAAGALIRAVWWNIVHLRKTLGKRRRIQQTIRAVPDSSFLPGVTRRVTYRYYIEQFFGNLERYQDLPVVLKAAS